MFKNNSCSFVHHLLSDHRNSGAYCRMAHRQKNPHLRDISSLRMVQWAFIVICRICGVKLTVKGQGNVPKDVPVIYVANHNSYFDIMITYALCPDLTGYIKGFSGKGSAAEHLDEPALLPVSET
ncbi:MAG: 1-acyl-sn-glycerol-3-phosphate acyltransferase [Eubacterium ramulus]